MTAGTVQLTAEPRLLKRMTLTADRAAKRRTPSEIHGGDHEGTQGDADKVDKVDRTILIAACDARSVGVMSRRRCGTQ